MPAWLVRLWPALAAVGAVIGIALWLGSLTDAAYEQGVADERAKWERAEKERQIAFRERADTASAKAAERDAERERVFIPIEKEVIRYVQTEPASVVCLDDAGRGILQRAIEAANSSIAAGAAQGGPAVPTAAGRSGDGG